MNNKVAPAATPASAGGSGADGGMFSVRPRESTVTSTLNDDAGQAKERNNEEQEKMNPSLSLPAAVDKAVERGESGLVESGGVEGRLVNNMPLGSVHDLYHELRLEAQAAGAELQASEEEGKFDPEQTIKSFAKILLSKILPANVEISTAAGQEIKKMEARVEDQAAVLAGKLKQKVVGLIKTLVKHLATQEKDQQKRLEKDIKTAVMSLVANDDDVATFWYAIKTDAKSLPASIKGVADESTIQDDIAKVVVDLTEELAEKAVQVGETVRRIRGELHGLLGRVLRPVLLLAEGTMDDILKKLVGAEQDAKHIGALGDVLSELSKEELDAKVKQKIRALRQKLADKARAFLGQLTDQIKAEVKEIASGVAQSLVKIEIDAAADPVTFLSSGTQMDGGSGGSGGSGGPIASASSKTSYQFKKDAAKKTMMKELLQISKSRVKTTLDRFFGEIKEVLLDDLPGHDEMENQLEKQVNEKLDSIKEQIVTEIEPSLEDLAKKAQTLASAVGGAGDVVANALIAAQETVEGILSDASSGVVEDITGDGELLSKLLSVVGPFLVKGATSLVTQRRQNPLAYDAERGQQLFVDFPSWWRHTLLFRNLSGERKLGTAYLLSNFLLNCWFFAVYLFFVPVDMIEDNLASNTSLDPGGENGTLLIRPQIDHWKQNNKLIENIFLFLGFFVLPWVILAMGKVLIDTAKLPLCGSMASTLEGHYGGKLKGHAILKSTVWTPVDRRSRNLYFGAIGVSVLGVAGVIFHYSYNKKVRKCARRVNSLRCARSAKKCVCL